MKKIIALILAIAFLAITPAQAAAPVRKAVPTQSPGGGQWCCADRSV